MQFKYPEVLFFLFLLLIPLLIHLFNLQKFKKEAFTNVTFLKDIELKTRKSSRLKKLLILLTRMLAFAALIFAFAQPFINNNEGLQKMKTLFYIDNSLSLQAIGENGADRLQLTKNHLLDNLDNLEEQLSLVTNQNFAIDLDQKSFGKALMELDFHPINKHINQVLLEINSYGKKDISKNTEVYLVSDFQNLNKVMDTALISKNYIYNLVDLSNGDGENISVDSIWLTEVDANKFTLKSRIRSHGMSFDDLSVSLFLKNELYAKTSFPLKMNENHEIEFVIPVLDTIYGKVSLTDHRLSFDNDLYFSLPKRPKTKILSIGKPSEFLVKIYPESDFNLIQTTYSELDQSVISSQDLIILNELDFFSNPLILSLKNFLENKGNLVVIPSSKIDRESYNNFLFSFQAGRITGEFKTEKRVNRINYNHPFFEKVFEKEIYNFQYPILLQGYETELKNGSSLLQFEDMSDFISEIKYTEHQLYWIASPLSLVGNQFVNSPLIVPVFFNFTLQDNQDNALYFTIGQANEIVSGFVSTDDQPFKIEGNKMEFIPLQSKTGEKTKIVTQDFPLKAGIYNLKYKDQLIERLAYNYDRSESKMKFTELQTVTDQFENIHLHNSLKNALKSVNDRNNNKNLWQLFIIFALVFLILEILLQKFLKN